MSVSALRSVASIAAFAAVAALAGCVSTTVIKTNADPVLKATREVPEPELLDVGISVFDPGLPKTDEEREKAIKELVFPEVRHAESRYFPYVLKHTIEDAGHWGAVRVIPRPSNSVDLTVQGRIVMSDGSEFDLKQGDIATIPAGHDGWVVGDKPATMIDFGGVAKPF